MNINAAFTQSRQKSHRASFPFFSFWTKPTTNEKRKWKPLTDIL